MSAAQRNLTVEQVRSAVAARLAPEIEGSTIVVEFHPPKSSGDGWHWVVRKWPLQLNKRPLLIDHARSKVIAEQLAAEWRERDLEILRAKR